MNNSNNLDSLDKCEMLENSERFDSAKCPNKSVTSFTNPSLTYKVINLCANIPIKIFALNRYDYKISLPLAQFSFLCFEIFIFHTMQ